MVRPEPDGTIRMRAAARSARGGRAHPWVGLFVCVLSVAAVVGTPQGAGAHPLVLSSSLFLLGAALTVWGLWGIFVWEEWRVGPDLLEVQQRLFGCRRVSRYRGAALK